MRLARAPRFCRIFLLAAAAAAADAPLVAARLDAANFAALAPGGVDATAGVGDCALSNGALCAVVSDPSRESDLAPFGGALVDLGHCGRGDDQLVVVQPLANLARSGAVRAERVRADGDARRGAHRDQRPPRRLRRRDAPTRSTARADAAAHHDARRAPRVRRARSSRSATSRCRPSTRCGPSRSTRAAAAARTASRIRRSTSTSALLGRGARRAPADTRILVGAQAIEPGIAYALRATRAERQRDGARPVAAAGACRSPPRASPGSPPSPHRSGAAAIASARSRCSRRCGWTSRSATTLVFEREIRVSRARRRGVAHRPDLPRARGASPAASTTRGASLVVSDAATGRVVTQVRPEPDGRFAFSAARAATLPTRRARLRGRRDAARSFAVDDADVDLGALAAPPLGSVELPRGTAMRLTFLGDRRHARPALRRRATGRRASATTRRRRRTLTRDVSLAGVDGDPARDRARARPLPRARGSRARVRRHRDAARGRARASASRSRSRRRSACSRRRAGSAPTSTSTPRRATTPRCRSTRASRSFVAEGDEVLVATDHDMVTDYGAADPRARARRPRSRASSARK